MLKKLLGFFICIVLCVCTILVYVLYRILKENVFLPSEYLFYEGDIICNVLMIPVYIITFFVIKFLVSYIKRKFLSKSDDYLYYVREVRRYGKWKVLILIFYVISIYICFTSLTYVTEDKIVVVSPVNLKGREYNYSDVEMIETGFGNKKLSFIEYKKEGNFYYKITVDGRKIVFHIPYSNENIDRYEDTYLWLEEFDQALSKYNIPKESSSKGYEKCDYDQRYVDRFLRIIESD
ncbi:MAG: hypothetical protein E7267_06930 [Lachnospiraceae bacterium]|nr:hypothetical protein [Lachnospiraceae bacterium]